MRTSNPMIADLAQRAGIVFDGALDLMARDRLTPGAGAAPGAEWGGLDMRAVQMSFDAMMAQDAPAYQQPSLITTPNSAIPAFLTTYLDPKLIAVLLAPVKAADIYGESKKGDWTTDTAMFSMLEMTGAVASYGDFNEAGRSDANVQFPQRQSYRFQTFTEWGDLELERMALAKIDWAAQKNISSANSMNRFMNLTYFYGVAGLQNYGALNDPSLSAPITPATKVAGGTSWANALPTEILADVQAMFAVLQTQTGGTLELTDRMTLAIHPTSDVYLANTNSFGLTAAEMIKKAFPNLTVKTAVQFLSGTTYSAQMIVDEIEGQRTVDCCFTEKFRAHRIIPSTSSFMQKKSAGTWGAIIFRPVGIAGMAGI